MSKQTLYAAAGIGMARLKKDGWIQGLAVDREMPHSVANVGRLDICPLSGACGTGWLFRRLPVRATPRSRSRSVHG
jgi:hypothetical protein